ncbi:uncharacterized protein LOC130785261 [Actinidia eriantha]|uniref:uncharacterized protein LOC130785261 n=1 Tax=Actinidia eriantha TaxID=165200 RepID=UPI002584BE80|nr:uncharacterized protein LOC130785261 [Actinidia eriantha]XP_057501380.1 uncharacterized protein LOC130785261 [Actinidia eriantha]XP_057501390.1 uncharacterized protein LOC130785261 [Actinidia eriantha]XP_057501398.1 uncharacterized protein LOC130785261 [Actinidia eriantha]XP_057501406.1 uncharacterized protein LOC130785261 [Actinidia eriantha]XP_057501413.1 uncharacterized protein LOC130785261 [Actinidia eriantha]
MGFARSVGHGIKDFLSILARSVFQSRAGLMTGMAQGTTSLVSNTVFAISDAAVQFSRAAHKGIVAFTFEDQPVARVEKQQKGEPSHSEGVENEFLRGGMKVKADRDESSSYAAMLAAQDVSQICKDLGINALRIKLRATGGNKTKTPGPGAQSALRALARSGIETIRLQHKDFNDFTIAPDDSLLSVKEKKRQETNYVTGLDMPDLLSNSLSSPHEGYQTTQMFPDSVPRSEPSGLHSC